MSYQFRYQFPVQGHLALVDAVYMRIWAVTSDVEYAKKIQTTFVSKLSLLIFDVAAWPDLDQVLDNHTYHDYELEPTTDPWLATYNPTNAKLQGIVTGFHDGPLSVVTATTTTLLIQDRQLELIDQINLYHHVLRLFDMTNHDHAMAPQIDEIFCQHIDLDSIETALANLMLQVQGTIPTLPSEVLRTLGRNLYE